jgi:hypothetical protein
MRSRPSPITAPRSRRFRNCCDAGHEPTHASPHVQNRDTIMTRNLQRIVPIEPGRMTNDENLAVLGRFATAGNIRSLLGTKLLVNRRTGDLTYQDSGLMTWWNRTGADSLTKAANYELVTHVFDVARVERNRLSTHDAISSKVNRILWAFKGYSTLVRCGYNEENLITQVRKISRICRNLFFVPYFHALSQSSLIPSGNKGVCWAFVLDWLRRGFKGKNDYRNARRMDSKMEAIMALQDDQLEIKYRQRLHQWGGRDGDVRIVDPEKPFFNQAAYQGRNAPATGNAAQRFSPRFDGILYRAPRHFAIAPAERRCYGVHRPGTEQPSFLGNEILQYIKEDALASAAGGDRDRGWMLSLSYRDYFTDAPTDGHAVGLRLSPCGTWAAYFEPNFGTGEVDANYADFWINSMILRNSLDYAVESVRVHRVSTS